MNQEDSKKKEDLEIKDNPANISEIQKKNEVEIHVSDDDQKNNPIQEVTSDENGKQIHVDKIRKKQRKRNAKASTQVIERRGKLLRKLYKIGCDEKDLQIASRVVSGEQLKTIAADMNLNYNTLRQMVSMPKYALHNAIQAFKMSLAEGYADLADLILHRARGEIVSGKAESAYKFSMLGLEIIKICEPQKTKEAAEVIVPFFEDVTDKSTSS